MPTRSWSTRHLGCEIVLRNHWSLFPPRSGETLMVDGEVVARNEGSVFLDMQSEISAWVGHDTGAFHVTGRVGQKGLRPGGQILIDGAFAGGEERIRFYDQARLETMLKGGFVGYFLRHGLPEIGLPFGLSMAVVHVVGDADTGFPDFLRQALVGSVLFAAPMSVFMYLYLRRLSRKQNARRE